MASTTCPSVRTYINFSVHKSKAWRRRCSSSVSDSLTEVPGDKVKLKLKCVTLDPEKNRIEMSKYERMPMSNERETKQITIRKSNTMSLLWWCNQREGQLQIMFHSSTNLSVTTSRMCVWACDSFLFSTVGSTSSDEAERRYDDECQ